MGKRPSAVFSLVVELAALLLLLCEVRYVAQVIGAEPAAATAKVQGGTVTGIDAARDILKEFQARRLPRKEKPGFCGLDLSDASKTDRLAELPDLYERDPCDPNVMRLRKAIVVARHPEHWCEGVIYYTPAKDLYYVSLEPGHPGMNPFYGPFQGKPWKRLKMFEPKPAKNKYRFAIYLVADDIDAGKRDEIALEQLHLAPEPIITEKDMLGYEWDRHILKLAAGVRGRIQSPGVWGAPFVVFADGERCYLGAFWTHVSSYMPSLAMAYVDPIAARLDPNDAIRIEAPPISGAKDPRGDLRIRKALESLGFVRPAKAAAAPPRKIAVSLDKQLEAPVDFSHWTRDTTFGQAIDDVKSSVDPPLRLIVLWKDLYESAAIDQDTAIGMDGVSGVPLGVALKSLLMAVAGSPGQLGYIIDGGVITVATKDSLREKWQTRVYDVRDLF